jgi:hypothetical protein
LVHNQNDRSANLFAEDLASLLLRYAPLQKGLQAAIPLAVFELLRSEYDTECECFASPLNSQLARFCSAFPQDLAFGALGSFFDFSPVEGSFEVNPPFVASVIEQAFHHMTALLASLLPLQFVVIVPTWSSQLCFQLLQQSVFLSRTVSLPVRDHVFVHSSPMAPRDVRLVHGVQHASTNASTIFFLQNSPGRAKWTISNNSVKRLHLAFARSPSPASAPAPPPSSGPPPMRRGSNWNAIKKTIKKRK